jgi:hypothetical protein
MLDSESSEPHQRECRALVHAVEYVFVHVAARHALRSVGATRLQGATATVFGLCLVEHSAVLAMKLLAAHRLACRTEIAVGLRLPGELRAVEQVPAASARSNPSSLIASGFTNASITPHT